VLYYYTEPFDVVVDPMSGGGTSSTYARKPAAVIGATISSRFGTTSGSTTSRRASPLNARAVI